MKTKTPGGVAVVEEAWGTALIREQREARTAQQSQREETERAEAERQRALSERIGSWWFDFAASWRAAAEELRGDEARRVGVSIGLGRCEIRASDLLGNALGNARVVIDNDGFLVVTRLVLGSGTTIYVPLSPAADGGIDPAPAIAVEEIVKPWFRQLGKVVAA